MSDQQTHLADVQTSGAPSAAEMQILTEQYKNHYQNAHIPDLDIGDQRLAFEQSPRYKFIKRLDKGTYASVYEVVKNEDIDSKCAIKIFKSSPRLYYNQDELPDEINFLDLFLQNPHQNVLTFFTYFRSPDWHRYYLVCELAATDLYQALHRPNRHGVKVWEPLKEYICRHLISGIARGVQHMHRIGIAHCDLKLENVLLFHTPVPDGMEKYTEEFFKYIPKLADFSNSIRFDANNPLDPDRKWDGPLCTIFTAAPESWFMAPNTTYDVIKADVFSLGALLLTLFLGAHPFQKTQEYLSLRGQRFFGDQSCNQQKTDIHFKEQLCRGFRLPLKEVLLRLLEADPQKRISIDEFLSDKWMAEKTRTQELEDIPYTAPKPEMKAYLKDV